jgi:hypothetical protein
MSDIDHVSGRGNSSATAWTPTIGGFPGIKQLGTAGDVPRRAAGVGTFDPAARKSPDALRRTATPDDIPDAELDRLSTMGFDWIWFLSVWQTGPAGQRVSRSGAENSRRR